VVDRALLHILASPRRRRQWTGERIFRPSLSVLDTLTRGREGTRRNVNQFTSSVYYDSIQAIIKVKDGLRRR